MATQLAPLSACVTRILLVSGFPKELRTKDINQAFSDWENVQGGFKIKWIDDTSLYVVFQDPTVAKRAYLQALHSPPAIFSSSTSTQYTKIRPYDGADTQQILQFVSSRGNGTHNRGHSTRASISVGGGVAGAHARMGSVAQRGNAHEAAAQYISIPPSSSAPQVATVREPSPTLPNLPTQPTLNSLISSSLSSDHMPPPVNAESAVPSGVPPRIGDPGRRMVAHSLGVKHPGLSRSLSGDELSARMKDLQKGAQTMAIAE